MVAAGKEEKALAIARNDLHEGVPSITVVVDGGWAKRSHKHSYNSLSGVAIIIGKETGKILFMGVRNKYCSSCAQAENKNTEPPKHHCFKNWTGSSSSMETDILVEGFQKAESQHGLRYTRFVGDGDSSVYPNLIAKVPGYGYAIRKIECANHATKNYRSALEKLVQDNPSYKGRGKLTDGMRKRLTKAARCAISMRSRESNKKLAIKLLREDLHNGPRHCFGIHIKCSTDFCKTARERLSQQSASSAPVGSSEISPEQTVSSQTAATSFQTPVSSSQTPVSFYSDSAVCISDIEDILQEQEEAWTDATNDSDLDAVRSVDDALEKVDERMPCDIQSLADRLVAKADMLLGNFTTNLCEGWMHIHTKFDGGKQIN